MKRFLIAVDLQNDFIDGSLGSGMAQAIVPGCVRRIGEYRAAGDTVIATMDTHGEDYLSTREGRFLPVKHCIKNTPGWELNPDVRAALSGCAILEKGTFGSVHLPELIEALSGGDDISVELMGLCTDICVVSNAMLIKAHFPEADVCVNAPLCAGVTQESHEAALATMQSCQIAVTR